MCGKKRVHLSAVSANKDSEFEESLLLNNDHVLHK